MDGIHMFENMCMNKKSSSHNVFERVKYPNVILCLNFVCKNTKNIYIKMFSYLY